MKPFNTGFGFLFFSFVFFQLPCLSFAQSSQPVLKRGVEKFDLSGLYSSKHGAKPVPAANPAEARGFPFGNQPYTEDIDKRTYTSRTFTGNDGEVIIHCSSQRINYLNKEKKLQPISARLSVFSEGWYAPSQEFPTFLFKDGSVALSAARGGTAAGKLFFNKNCTVNGTAISFADFSVGEDGMHIQNAVPGVDKKIIFNENRIKTEYIINKPLSLSGNDLLLSEEIVIPEGYSVKMLKKEICLILSPRGKEAARFSTPVFYDSDRNFLTGKYNLKKSAGKTTLQIIVPGNWLNNPARKFPVTIDPLVTGPVSNYPAVYMNSCVMPSYAYDSMLVTIPGGITITGFFVTDSYYADPLVGAWYSQGAMKFSSPCGTTGNYTIASPVGDSSGYAYLDNADLKNYMACCFVPSCDSQTFYITHYIGRTSIYGTGCNQNSIYYSPYSTWPFSAYIVGRTVEISPAPPWSVFPATLCSDSCTVFMKVTARYGVPPYTMTHPWSADTIKFGTAFSSCNCTGTDTISLKIPGCPFICDTVSSLSVPPPLIIDSCGDTITGLLPKIIALNPVPSSTASPVALCAGEQVYIPVSSCIGGSSITWTGSNGSAGTGDIFDNPNLTGPDTIDYTISNLAGSCQGQAETVSAVIFPKYSIPETANICAGNSIFLQGAYQTQPGTYYDTLTTGSGCDSIIITTLTVTGISSASTAEICEGQSIFLQGNYQVFPGTYYDTLATPGGCDSVIATTLTVFPLPLISTSPDVTIHAGDSTQLIASGGAGYLWSSGDSTAAITVSPSESTTYSVAGTDTNNCSSSAMVTVTVENSYQVSVSNIFTPNGDNENDFIFVHGNGIKELKFAIFDRLGEKVFETKDKSAGWDGTYKNKPLNSAVFAYFLVAVFEDGTEYKEKGNITLLR